MNNFYTEEHKNSTGIAIENNGTLYYWTVKWLEINKHSVKKSTYIKYYNLIENHIKDEIGIYSISTINLVSITTYINEKMENGRMDGTGGLSKQTVSEIITILKNACRYAEASGCTINCSLDFINIKSTINDTRTLDVVEENKLLQILCCNIDKYKLGILICIHTGIRIGELCALKWEDVWFDEQVIRINKTMQRIQNKDNMNKKTTVQITSPKSQTSNRLIPISEKLLELLIKYKGAPEEYVLSTNGKEYTEPRTMQYRFKKYIAEADIKDANFHILRHTFATRCIESGCDAEALSEILGHANVSLTLNRYVHSSLEHKRTCIDKYATSFEKTFS